MCDTLVFKNQDYTILAKNSDREPNEAQAVLHLPRMHQQSSSVKCTYIEIPQVSETYEVLLSKPFQMWGAEMGVNEHGVAIGNEAVFTKIKHVKKNEGLTGMDMIRLALERSVSARAALKLICELLETYGQDACGGYYDKNFYYHNSFLIADAQQVYKLETAGRHWAYAEIDHYDSISNGLTIEDDYTAISDHAIEESVRRGWIESGSLFSFRKAYSDKLHTKFSKCKERRAHTYSCVASSSAFTVSDAIKALRGHASADFDPAHCSADSVCMHPTGPLNPSQTNGSMIVSLRPSQAPEIWITGTSMPCLSIYKPYSLGEKADIGLAPTSKVDRSIWWQAERAHRRICREYHRGTRLHHEVFENLQAEILENRYSTQKSWQLYSERLSLLNKKLDSQKYRSRSINPIYRYHWHKWNKAAGLI